MEEKIDEHLNPFSIAMILHSSEGFAPMVEREKTRLKNNRKHMKNMEKNVKLSKEHKKQANIEMCGVLYSKYGGNISAESDMKNMMEDEMKGYRLRYWFMLDKEYRKYTQVRYINKYLVYIIDSVNKNETRKIPPWMLTDRTYRILESIGGVSIKKINIEKYMMLKYTNKYNKTIGRNVVNEKEIFYNENENYIYKLLEKEYKYILYENEVEKRDVFMELSIKSKDNVFTGEKTIKINEWVPYYSELDYSTKNKLNDIQGDGYVLPNYIVTKLNKMLYKYYFEYKYSEF